MKNINYKLLKENFDRYIQGEAASNHDTVDSLTEARSIGKRNITKLKSIVQQAYDRNKGVTPMYIEDNLIPKEWFDIWEAAEQEIFRLISDELGRIKHEDRLDNYNVGRIYEQVTKLPDIASKYNIQPSGEDGKFKMADFDGEFSKFSREDFYAFCEFFANAYLRRKIGLSWDDLDDTNSLWDYVDQKSSSTKELVSSIHEACNDRISEVDFGGDLFT